MLEGVSTERQYVVQGRKDSEAERLRHMLDNMEFNKAYIYAVAKAGGDPDGALLKRFRERFLWYRNGWRQLPKKAIDQKLTHEKFAQEGHPPLCVDIETAAVCDLACPFCYRQWIATPDKYMRESFYQELIDQCKELGVPSIKLNWRGEPLLQPHLDKFVDYAKRAGILEVIINTNAVTLDEKKSRALITAGLDLMIFSYDGGSKKTYEAMRPGRFRPNTFESVYENIVQFSRIKKEMGAKFPRTKIQMVLTAETSKEKDAFFQLFEPYVDDVSVKAYTERGGEVPDLSDAEKAYVDTFRKERGLSDPANYWRDLKGDLHFSVGRLPCEQPYQRLMVTYDGRVSMCCYDWGSEYPVGYLDEEAFAEGDVQYQNVLKKAESGAHGFELLQGIKMPRRLIDPPKRKQTLKEIWSGEIINNVRKKHVDGCLQEISVCTHCPFKETYQWIKVQ